MKNSILKDKSFSFAIQIVKLAKYLNEEKKEFILSKQLLRSGTAIGANIREAEFGQSKADFVNKLYIALKEANETDYWLSILKETDSIEDIEINPIQAVNKELIAILVSSIKTVKKSIEK